MASRKRAKKAGGPEEGVPRGVEDWHVGCPRCRVCEYQGARRCRVTARSHPTPASLVAPRLLLMCAPPPNRPSATVYSALLAGSPAERR